MARWPSVSKKFVAQILSAHAGLGVVAGAVLFIPWVPSFVDQLTSTGTPWATAGRPASAVVELTP